MRLGIATPFSLAAFRQLNADPAPAPGSPKPGGKEIPADAPPPSAEPPKNERPVKRQILQFDERQEVTITRDWDKPVTQRTRLGSIPADYYEHAWGFPTPGHGYWPSREWSANCHGGQCDMGPVAVTRDVPVYDANGQPQKERVTQTLSEKSHNQKASFLTGGGVGLGLGAAAGVGLLAALGGLGGGAGLVAGLLGGAAGAAAGAAVGYKAVDNDKVEEVWMQDDILHPTMTGYTERVTPDVWHEQRCHTERDRNDQDRQVCETWSTLRGYDHDFYPDLSWRRVGDYTYPTLQHTSKVTPVGAGFLAAAAGAGAGSLAALAVRFLPMLL